MKGIRIVLMLLATLALAACEDIDFGDCSNTPCPVTPRYYERCVASSKRIYYYYGFGNCGCQTNCSYCEKDIAAYCAGPSVDFSAVPIDFSSPPD